MYLHNGYTPYGFDLDDREKLPQRDKQFHKVRDYSVGTLQVEKLQKDFQLQGQQLDLE